MDSYQFATIGLIHFLFAILSMVLGAMIILLKKGDRKHKIIGYCYVFCMFGLNISALTIYDLFEFFGPFHVFALFSLATVIGGFIPAFLKKPEDSWLEYHYEFMNWSVVGLYAAFWSETFMKFFSFVGMTGFWLLVGSATVITVGIGAYFIKKKKVKMLGKYEH
ncbi:DUF2306 domain-containing protein [Gracilimonas sp.]|uniref:DUF2306 domain-containing protein n=1 Tax=Gracilimonas sp. TaxID=1974203 RepID=UPI0028726878|nr:DUF2306 domain-containing protein [Gracilimonas sp.]